MVDIDSGEFETIPKYELNFGIRYFFFFSFEWLILSGIFGNSGTSYKFLVIS